MIAVALDVAYWAIPAGIVAALIVRDERRIRTARRHSTPKEPS
ncbi:MAG TPA: hypothetical protein VHX38_18615 [Pseudonocardiaceae bacterium]|jgi:hypothetical protein|nr:hypothetical protein [Pseudonocardiaceae bacterium]